MPRLNGLLETCLYVDDMHRLVCFFREVMGLPTMLETERLTAFNTGNRGILLIFKRGESTQDTRTNAGLLPGHDGAGKLHLAFAIPADSFEAWRDHLCAAGVKPRGEMLWSGGGRSLYFEDPDGHVLEVATPGLWPNY